MAYRPAGPPDKGNFAKTGDSSRGLSLLKNTGDSGDSGDGPATVDQVIDDRIIAVLIDSPVVGPVWFAFDDGFKSGDDIPVFFVSELPFLQKMGETELRRRYEQKQALGGGWIRDRLGEPTKH